ncbi:MAG: hypothetical protein JWN82_649 [Candidatus Saccharibacteria bacterium]|nr:hypothetical protein [Candidatus Saccharibacteria bacterium]
MPEEPNSIPIEEQPPEHAEGWHQLAQDSADWPSDHEGLQTFKKNHLDRVLGERGLGHLVVSQEDESDATFLHGRDSKLHLSPDVENSVNYLRDQGNKIPNEPARKIAAHMNLRKDTNYINDGILTGDKSSMERQVEAHVMEAEEVPESYFDNMLQTYRDEGQGGITLTEEMRERVIEELQTAQRFSLEEWATYLGNNADYPGGFKTYVWDSISKLKPYDPYKETFPKRSKGTVAPYPMFNPDAVEKVHELVQAGDSRGFAKLYTEAVHSLDYFDPELLKSVDGAWRKFERSDDPEAAKQLSSTLNEKTGWCVAGESFAGHYLKSGDFWVYYTVGKDGEYTTPRAAIATGAKSIREIRGILPGQVLEPQMLDVAYSKAAELPGGEKYLTTREDMRWVTKIFNKVNDNPNAELSPKDLRFIYEFDRGIGKVDSEKDPRIEEIRQQRDWVADMMALHGVEDHKSLFDAVLSEYDRSQALPLLLKEKKRHHTFGYSLSREEKENKRQRELGARQYNDLIGNLPYLELDPETAEEFISRGDRNLTRVVANARSFGFEDISTCVSSLIDSGHGIEMLSKIAYADVPDMQRHQKVIVDTLLSRGMEKDILQSHVRNPALRIAAIEKTVSNIDFEQLVPDGAHKAEVKTALVDLFKSISSGTRSRQIILPTMDDVTQLEQVLPQYLKDMDIQTATFTPNKQRDLEIGLKTYRPNRHGKGTPNYIWDDVVIVDRGDLRHGDLLFKNLVRDNPDRIIVSVATKPYEGIRLPKDAEGLLALTPDEAQSLDPAKAAPLYEKLLEKEGMPEELDGEMPVAPEDIDEIADDPRINQLVR